MGTLKAFSEQPFTCAKTPACYGRSRFLSQQQFFVACKRDTCFEWSQHGCNIAPASGSAAHAVLEGERQATELQPPQPAHKPQYVREPNASLAGSSQRKSSAWRLRWRPCRARQRLTGSKFQRRGDSGKSCSVASGGCVASSATAASGQPSTCRGLWCEVATGPRQLWGSAA